MRRVLLAVMVVGTALLTAPAARACSCIPPDAARMLPDADGAFVGTFLDRDQVVPAPGGETPTDVFSGDPVGYRFSVDRVVKGDIDGRVTILAPADGASCGLEVRPGQRVGLVLRRQDGSWHSSLCQTFYEPDALLAAAPVSDPPNEDGGGFNWPLTVVAVALVASVVAVGAVHMRRST